jgi:very-short-patch-repair endonuclease
MADEGTLRRRARRLRHHQTRAESLLWSVLRDRRLDGFKFRRQVLIASDIVDFLCSRAKLIVEVDGATHSSPEELAYDRQCELILSRLGYRILRVGNDDVYKSMPAVLSTVLAALEAPSQAEDPSSAPSGHLLPVKNGEKGVRRVALASKLKGSWPHCLGSTT